MDGTRTKTAEGGKMGGGTIAFMAGKIITRKFFIKICH